MGSDTIRLFVGIALDEATLVELEQYQAAIRGSLSEFRWIRREALHMTLKYLGPLPHEDLEAVIALLRAAVTKTPGGEISMKNVVALPTPRRTRVLALETSAPESLFTIATDLNGAFEDLGVAPEKRAFLPHITLARCRGSRPPTVELTRLSKPPQAPYVYSSVTLFESRLRPAGAEYVRIHEVPLLAIS